MNSFVEIEALCRDLPGPDLDAAAAARARQAALTKPPGSLGRLEQLVEWLAGWQRRAMPQLERVQIVVFAGNHGVTARAVSPYPASVTAQMVGNFQAGGAAINQLARQAGAALLVHGIDVARPTGDITVEPALSEPDFAAAFQVGYETVTADLDLLALGEMGIGNTTVAAALAAGLFGGTGADWAGRGAGVDDSGLRRKQAAIDAALARHADVGGVVPRAAALGGRELAAIFGAALAARRLHVPVVLDGFVSTAAAAPLARLVPGGLDHAVVGHASAEAGHRRLLEALAMPPLLALGMRLGEASGAALAISVLRGAVACHSGMATFAEAGVSDRT